MTLNQIIRQIRLFYHEGRPAAVLLYAFVSDEVAARLDAGAPTLRPADWKSGERVRIVKVIAPFGGAEEFGREALLAVQESKPGQLKESK